MRQFHPVPKSFKFNLSKYEGNIIRVLLMHPPTRLNWAQIASQIDIAHQSIRASRSESIVLTGQPELNNVSVCVCYIFFSDSAHHVWMQNLQIRRYQIVRDC